MVAVVANICAVLLLGWAAATQAATPAPHPAAALIDAAQDASHREPAELFRIAQQALHELAARPDADLEIQARLLLCQHHAESDTAAALREAAIIEELLPRARRSGLRAGALICRGQMREYAGDSTRARALYEEAVAVAETTGDEEQLADALHERGYIRSLQGELASALTDLRRAHQLYLRIHRPQRLANTMDAIALVYDRMGDHAQARDYLQQTLVEQQQHRSLREQAVTLHNLGRATEHLGDFAAARRQYEDALTLFRQIDLRRGEAYSLRGLGSLANRAGDAAGALRLLDQADERATGLPDERLRGQILLQRGIAQRLLKHNADSVASLNEALRIFALADSRNELAEVYGALALSHAQGGDWRAAYERATDHKIESDRLMRLQLDQRFATLKIEFDTAAKERDNALLHLEKQATQRALEQERRAGQLQIAVIALAAVALLALALLAVRQRRAGRAMRSLALTDELTGLPNRRDVLARLQVLIAQPQARPCSVLLADLDHFKRINDEHGHLVGDEVLRQVAARLTDSVREPVFVGRLGGEEFLVVLPETELEAARQVAERIREGVAALDMTRWGAETRITVSLGIAVCEGADDSVSGMLSRADAALYDAKRTGRNRVIALVA